MKVAQTERDRAEQLWAANIIAKIQEEKAKYQYDATEFEVERQREDMRLRKRRSGLWSLNWKKPESRPHLMASSLDAIFAWGRKWPRMIAFFGYRQSLPYA